MKRTNTNIKGLPKTALFNSLKKSFSNSFFAAVFHECWSWCSFWTMMIDQTTKHDGRWLDVIPFPSINVNCGSAWCSSFCCVNSRQAWVEICWILHLVTSDVDSGYPVGTQRPRDVVWRFSKGPNARDLAGTYRRPSEKQYKNWWFSKKIAF